MAGGEGRGHAMRNLGLGDVEPKYGDALKICAGRGVSGKWDTGAGKAARRRPPATFPLEHPAVI